MFESVDTALALLEEGLEQLDPDALEPAVARDLFEKFCRVERLGAAGKALSARRVANSGAWVDTGERSPAHWMASVAGSSVGRAVAVLQTAELLESLPETEAAYRRGRLSEPQVEEIASAAALFPESQEDLLAAAEIEPLVGLKRQCAWVRARARSEMERHEYLHRRRQLRHWTDVEGAFRLDGRFTPESGAVILAALEPFKQRAALRAANREPAAAYAADALVAVAERSRCVPEDAVRPGPGAVVHVRVDYSALIRGRVGPGEICEVPGVGPIPVSAARNFVSDSFLAAIVADGEDIKAVSHLGRTIPERLRTALIERDPVCVVPGCAEHEDLEFDHIVPVHRRGRTSLENLARLCRWHHYLKTFHSYVLDRVGGEWIWVGPNGPPADPGAQQPELVAAR